MVLFAENTREGETHHSQGWFPSPWETSIYFSLFTFLSQATKRKQPVLSTLGLEISGNKCPGFLLKFCFCLPECQSAKSHHCNEDHLSPVSKNGLAALRDFYSHAFNVGIPSKILFITQMYLFSATMATFSTAHLFSFQAFPRATFIMRISVNSLSKAKQPFKCESQVFQCYPISKQSSYMWIL